MFGYQADIMFANISVIIVGDLLQLPPIRQDPAFYLFKNELLNLCHPWFWFQSCELTECMWQQGDKKFIDLLNAVREGNPCDHDIQLLQSRKVKDEDIPDSAVFTFATNAQKTGTASGAHQTVY